MREEQTAGERGSQERRKRQEIWLPPDARPNEAMVDPNAGLPYPDKPRLVVFGGSFDPIHAGHINLARKVLEAELGDEVLFVPAKHSPLKPMAQSGSAAARLEMVRLALADALEQQRTYTVLDVNGQEQQREYLFSVSDLEIRRPGNASYTFDTLEMLRRIYPGHDIRLLIGTDCLASIRHWHRASELISRYDIIVYPRPGSEKVTFTELAATLGDAMAARLFRGVLLRPGGEPTRPRPRKMRPTLPTPPGEEPAAAPAVPAVPAVQVASSVSGDFMDAPEPMPAPAPEPMPEPSPAPAPEPAPVEEGPDAPPRPPKRPPLSRTLRPEDFPMLEVSSSDLRAAIAAGRVPPGLLSPSVADYIAKHHLYQDG